MKNKILILAIIVCIAVWVSVVANTYHIRTQQEDAIPSSYDECVSVGGSIDSSGPARCTVRGHVFVEDIGNGMEKRSLIRAVSPRPNVTITSPLVVKGEARGTWFFEASFPIKLVGQNGVVVASGIAQAKGEWMTESFVPFEAELQFTKPSRIRKGTLMLMRDNPSGDPSRDDALIIPVRF